MCLEASSLDIDDGHSRPPGPISAYGEDPPPAPQIHSKGVVATDITAQFIQSAERRLFLLVSASVIKSLS
jgi:hypothetical protein